MITQQDITDQGLSESVVAFLRSKGVKVEDARLKEANAFARTMFDLYEGKPRLVYNDRSLGMHLTNYNSSERYADLIEEISIYLTAFANSQIAAAEQRGYERGKSDLSTVDCWFREYQSNARMIERVWKLLKEAGHEPEDGSQIADKLKEALSANPTAENTVAAVDYSVKGDPTTGMRNISFPYAMEETSRVGLTNAIAAAIDQARKEAAPKLTADEEKFLEMNRGFPATVIGHTIAIIDRLTGGKAGGK